MKKSKTDWFRSNGGLIVGVESSCDESALSLFDPSVGLRGEWISSQIELHRAYGGVVPDLASREHLQNFGPLLEEMEEGLKGEVVAGVAVTQGPGLAGCLAMGLSVAKSLALKWDVPLVGINHLRAHAFSPFIKMHEEDSTSYDDSFEEMLPHIGLLVSGGNTILFEMNESVEIRILGSTRDDAAGEALDKGGKLMGIPYPGGPLIEKEALTGNCAAFEFPRAMLKNTPLDFSFSGLKTSLRYRLDKMDPEEIMSERANLCASYQEAVIDVLVKKTEGALRQRDYRSVGLSGGVSNNQRLGSAFTSLAEQNGVSAHFAQAEHTGDNAGMIAFAAWMERKRLVSDPDYSLEIVPSMKLSALL
ncbi:MAG: tRNA (adenosine(37)-N6)-threonylcarbamoyltransferase complex transferase subunit TsaD [Opitutaceae bacterium]|nr:tRNA (adenosine(37)-N6)-threonylcarbamoyltransferase complex transferase subunit TsaD [Opitutaceae bacterium]